MPELIDQKIITDRLRQWHFWFLVVFSLLLVVTFVFYLPLRFLHQSTTDDHEGFMSDESMPGRHSETIFHEEIDISRGLVSTFSAFPFPAQSGTTTALEFFVNKKPGNVPIFSRALEIEHEKLMHVIGVRSDMNEFFHVHPTETERPGVPSLLDEREKIHSYQNAHQLHASAFHALFLTHGKIWEHCPVSCLRKTQAR